MRASLPVGSAVGVVRCVAVALVAEVPVGVLLVVAVAPVVAGVPVVRVPVLEPLPALTLAACSVPFMSW
jgi:hypothetical protein